MTKKVLGLFSIVMINVVAVDSLRSLPFSAEYGFSLVFYYALAAIFFFLPVAFVAAELATAWPAKGGIYVWVREAFGEKWGFVVIWLQWIYNVVWYPTIMAFMAGAFAFLIDPHLAQDKFYMLSTVFIVFWAATIVNMFGMRLSSWVTSIGAVVGTLVPMLFIIILGVIWLWSGKPIQIHFTEKALLPNLASFENLAFMTAILFGLVGMELSATHADEVKNPKRIFPRAITYSAIIILSSLVLASLAIAIVVPQRQLDVVTGMLQAFYIFFHSYNMKWMDPVIVLLIIIGGIAGVSAWVIGPTKGLLVATRDGCAPKFFAKVNKKDVPVVILILQGIIFTILCGVFLIMPTVQSSYWALTVMTSQLSMLVYIGMFAGAIYLRYKKPDVIRQYKIPFGNIGMWIAGIFGLFSCIVAIMIGFFPPADLHIHNLFTYESILIIGMLVLTAPPLLIYRFTKNH